ncbi:hypothetical protein SPRG_09676 [Saprolegnia parasitica CBS 223.65]|uniref:Uncharacterized protein n=1 Tax=Saprolegnia parasitica (strain CBS 223.65) TaxID=695850 RepID=A0A067C2V2_SAPPC|nr:hypothetical protein SPRG_09676 [Saprolegnia parasitica CBS 223.65]KDO24843.1 hypothetical protein SPRG_09676 [Saprolegnia parasitica CBS 223.65]|eukprot:XP_012204490.1 hypothetical protein SPRG_09676 [Saprolegnia parasitica CBS 223.65]
MAGYVNTGTAANLSGIGAGGLLLWFGYASHEEAKTLERPPSKIWFQLALLVTLGLVVLTLRTVVETNDVAHGGLIAGSAVVMSTLYTLHLLEAPDASSTKAASTQQQQWS